MMKLITLNIWGGRVFDPLIDFLKFHALDTDIFCFQEIFHTSADKKISDKIRANIYSEIKKTLSNFQSFFAPAQDKVDSHGTVNFDISFGLATFVKNHIQINRHGDIFVFRHKNAMVGDDAATMGSNLEFITFKHNNKRFAIFNLHGLWNGKGKTDTKDRLEQSRKVKEFMNKFGSFKKILCGDFNLLPDTQSLAILDKDMKNLVKDFNVASTRSKFYVNPLRFADYILASPGVKVRRFEVLQDEVSDHLPLLLEFD